MPQFKPEEPRYIVTAVQLENDMFLVREADLSSYVNTDKFKVEKVIETKQVELDLTIKVQE